MNITIGNPWAVSEKGGRLNNEDSIFPLPETANSNQNLFLVCDGVEQPIDVIRAIHIGGENRS